MAKRVDWKAFFGGTLGYRSPRPQKLARLIEPGEKYDHDKYEPVDTGSPEYQYRAAANRQYAAEAREREAELLAARRLKYGEEQAWRNQFLNNYKLTPEQRNRLNAYPINPESPLGRVEFLDFFQHQYPQFRAEDERRVNALRY